MTGAGDLLEPPAVDRCARYAAMARIYRDAYGVPHVRADSILDLAHGQGRVTARGPRLAARVPAPPGDRHDRRDRSAAPALPWDRSWPAGRASAETAPRGVRGLRRRDASRSWRRTSTGSTPGCTPTRPELERARHRAGGVGAVDAAGGVPRPAPALRQPCPASSGSRARDGARRRRPASCRTRARPPPAATPGRSAASGPRSGLPLIGGDPHRIIESPGRLPAGPAGVRDPGEFDVRRLHLPRRARRPALRARRRRRVGDHQRHGRLPGRASTESHWTTSVERHDGDRSHGARGADPVEQVEVVETARGPVFEDRPRRAAGSACATPRRCWATSASTPSSRCCGRGPPTTSTAALDAWVEPVNNVVIADRDGRRALPDRRPGAGARRGQPAGHRRAADPERGLDRLARPLPRDDVPADGQVVTANERRGPESDAIGTSFAPPHRAARLHALLDGRTT